jgi:NADH-quinone oxidoreductase subunit H
LFMSVFIVNLFFGGWTMPFIYKFVPKIFLHLTALLFYVIKISLFAYLFIYIRAMLPRYRYDQLMKIGWQFILPIVIALFFFNAILVVFFTLKFGGFLWLKVII